MRVALQAATSEDLLAQTVPRVYPVTKVHTGHLDVLVNQVNALLMMTYLSFVVFFFYTTKKLYERTKCSVIVCTCRYTKLPQNRISKYTAFSNPLPNHRSRDLAHLIKAIGLRSL